MRRHLVMLAAGLALLAAGCQRQYPPPRYTPAWEKFDPGEGGWIKTRQALLIADCQLHNLYSLAVSDRNLSVDAAAGTAIRPPQLDLFAADVLEWVLQNGAPDAELIVHLGDAIDFSTEGEFETFVRVMDAAGRPWFMTPGNHDGYYLGSYYPERMGAWRDAAYDSGRPLTKDHFVRFYVAALLRQDEPGIAQMGRALGIEARPGQRLSEIAVKVPDRFEWSAGEDDAGLLRNICWEIDTERPWRSYVLQVIGMSPRNAEEFSAGVLLLDSCQYSRRPELVPNAWRSFPLPLNCGLTGQMLPNQLRKAREWVNEYRQAATIVPVLHHPFEALDPRTRSSLGWLWKERLGMMVTAHTHAGFFAHHDLGGESDHLELNIGSTTDWPMEWRTLQGFVNEERGEVYARAERKTLVDVLVEREGYFDRDWEVPDTAPDDYRKYKQGEYATGIIFSFAAAHHLIPYWIPKPEIKPNAAARSTEEQVKDTLLWTYHRLIVDFPTAPDEGDPVWPEGLRSDQEVIRRIDALAGKREALPKEERPKIGEREEEREVLEEKIAFLRELDAFERSRHSRDPESGESTDLVRARFKISQAAWASRFEKSEGRRLRLEDELIRVESGPADED